MTIQEKSQEPFDPLAVENVGVTLAVELLEQPLCRMPPDDGFGGAGVYALYYSGPHPAYASLVQLDSGRFKYPVYIGKAAGESSKQGFNSQTRGKKKLYDRIVQCGAAIGTMLIWVRQSIWRVETSGWGPAD